MPITLSSTYAQAGSAFTATVSGASAPTLTTNPGKRYRLNNRLLTADEPRDGDVIGIDGTAVTIMVRNRLRIVTQPPAAVVGIPYDFYPTIEGVAARYIFVGTAPSGLTINSTTGHISGTPTASGVVFLDVIDPSALFVPSGPPTPPLPVGKRLFSQNLAFPSDIEGNRQVNNLLLNGRQISYNGGGVVYDPLDISPTGKLLRINPSYPGGYAIICGMPLPYTQTRKMRIEGPADGSFTFTPLAPNVSATNRNPASGYISDDGSGKVKYPGNKYFEVDYTWTGDVATGPLNNLTTTYFGITGMGAGGFENAAYYEVSSSAAPAPTGFWSSAFVTECSQYHTIRALDFALTNETWWKGLPLTVANRAKPEWAQPPVGFKQASLIAGGTGNSRFKINPRSVYFNWLNGKLFQLAGNDNPYMPIGAAGNQLRLQIVAGSGGSPSWSVDFSTKIITLTLAAGGNTAAQVIASAGSNNSGPISGFNDLGLYIDSLSLPTGDDPGGASTGTGTVSTMGPTYFTGGIDAQVRGFYSIERIVELCNLAGCNLHYIIPQCATTAYAQFVGTYCAQNLVGQLYVEMGPNEAWNDGFAGTKWNIARTRGLNTYGQGSAGETQILSAASYVEVSMPLVNACKDAWVAAGRVAGDCERMFGWQHGYRPGAEFVLARPETAGKFDTYLSAPYNDGYLNGLSSLLNGESSDGPKVYGTGKTLDFVGQVFFDGGEAYAAKVALYTIQAGTTPAADTTHFALATAATTAPAFARRQAQVMQEAEDSKALADLYGLKYHFYEYGWHVLLASGTPYDCPRLIHDIATSDAGYDNFAKFVRETAARFPTTRITHLGQFSPAQFHTFGLSEYLGQPASAAARYRVMQAFQNGTLGAYVPQPSFSLNNVSQAEGNSGTTQFVFTLTLNPDLSNDAVPYTWAVNGTGTNPADASDFVGGVFPSGSGTFAAGPFRTRQKTAQIIVNVQGDLTQEQSETFLVTVSSPGLTSATGLGTIINDESSILFNSNFNGIPDGTLATSLGLTGYGAEANQFKVISNQLDWAKGSAPTGHSIVGKSAADHSVAYTLEQYGFPTYGIAGIVGGVDVNNFTYIAPYGSEPGITVWQLTKIVGGTMVADPFGYARTPDTAGGLIELRKVGRFATFLFNGTQYDFGNFGVGSTSTGVARDFGTTADTSTPMAGQPLNAPTGSIVGLTPLADDGNGGTIKVDNLTIRQL